MGLGSSRSAARHESDGQESERPSSKASESSVSENNIFMGGGVEQVPAVHNFTGSYSGTRESHTESRQQIKQEAGVAAEIQERRVHPPPRILSRTRQVNMDPLTRFHLRDNERLSELRHGQHSVEMQAWLRRYTGLAQSSDVVEPERSSAFMDSVPRVRQRGAEIPSQTRINAPATNDTSIGYNNTPVQVREPSVHRGRTGSVGPFEEVERYSIRDLVGNTRSVQRIASGSLYDSDLPVGSISRGEATGREARRNGGRRFWDALTRAASQRRLSNHQGAREDADPVLWPYSGRSTMSNTRVEVIDLSHREREDRYYQRNRSLNLEERRRRFRSQVWALQRLSTSFEGVPGHARSCAPGVRHESVGRSHESAQAPEENNTRASISRIIMLAEALFQVLDEIHRQSLALSRSAGLSLGSLPAPDAVVESMPVRIFQRVDTLENKEEAALQCHICLMEYEEGDQMRVLPCSHTYHMTCIDKWLRDVHRVCPLCRGDVCELKTTEDSA